jgi:hypothetical protein
VRSVEPQDPLHEVFQRISVRERTVARQSNAQETRVQERDEVCA